MKKMFNDKVLKLYDLTFLFQYKLLNTDTCRGVELEKEDYFNLVIYFGHFGPFRRKRLKEYWINFSLPPSDRIF